MASLLIVYASKTGTTKDIANGFAEKFTSFCDIYDCRERVIKYSGLEQRSIDIKDIIVKDYEIVVLGTAMYMGKPLKELTHFCKIHQNELKKKKLILYTCGVGTQEEDQKYLWNCLPDPITKSARLYLHLGGEIREDKMGCFSRMAMKEYVKQHGNINCVNYTNINKISKTVKELLSIEGENICQGEKV